MCQHRLADHIANGEDRRLVGPHLFVDDDEAALVDADARAVEARNLGVGPAPDRHQHAVEELGLVAVLDAFAVEGHADALGFGLHLDHARIEHHALHGLGDALGEDVHEITVCAREQPGRHLHDGHGAAERGIDRSELQANVAAPDDEQGGRDVGQVQRGGRVHHARIVHLERGWNGRHRAGGQDRVLELEGLGIVPRAARAAWAAGPADPQRVRTEDLGVALDVLYLPVLHQLASAAGQPLDDIVLELAQLREVDRRLGELHAPRARMTRLGHHLRDVQQCLGRDAAAVHADAARVLLGIDQGHGEPEIGGQKCRGVAARAGADNHELGSQCAHPCNASRKGCSSASTTQRRKRTASAPSMTL